MARKLAIGDIHGCFDALRTLADYAQFGDDDVIITLGDYVDRGPNSCAVVDWLIHAESHRELIPLRGNHELMMLEAFEGDSPVEDWLRVGGAETLKSYSPFDGDAGSFADIPDDHWDFLTARLLPFFETEHHFFVHASVYPDLALADQPEYMLYWERFDDPPRHDSGKIMVCGHTAQHTGLPLFNGNAICIDTWPHGDGWLSCLDVDTSMIWQANQRGQTRRFHLEESQAMLD